MLVKRHELFRISFDMADGAPVLNICPHLPFKWVMGILNTWKINIILIMYKNEG
ncbi:hypothetical protein [Marinisporobacter balticus]|uniref:Uncharacterized protein n=1 Tax=Marinisporobacter balticus TaxID=2018667 RepID=A0A4R2KAB9_9FIRM|nr:hypothetical protein [Marinisporobacter balticus]TCO70411.1 hypothetical protein EV214_12631 [Marinisporobacter balticus]